MLGGDSTNFHKLGDISAQLKDNRDLCQDNRDPNLLQNVHIFKLSGACNFQSVET